MVEKAEKFDSSGNLDDRQVKEDLNREGWEGDKEGGVAVVIGKEGEEVENLRTKLETEGRAENLETYIRLHKEVIVTAEEVERIVSESSGISQIPKKPEIGSFCLIFGKDNDFYLMYLDKNGNLARVFVNYNKVGTFANYKNLAPTEIASLIRSEISSLGFKERNYLPGDLNWFLYVSSKEESRNRIRSKMNSKDRFDF